LWLYHWLLRNKHNENVLEIACWGPHHIVKLEKKKRKIYFRALHQLEDTEFAKVVKRFFLNFT
jgi:hypothetical protein